MPCFGGGDGRDGQGSGLVGPPPAQGPVQAQGGEREQAGGGADAAEGAVALQGAAGHLADPVTSASTPSPMASTLRLWPSSPVITDAVPDSSPKADRDPDQP
jgi:hypothetical protein